MAVLLEYKATSYAGETQRSGSEYVEIKVLL
jgi:hypothetical protein